MTDQGERYDRMAHGYGTWWGPVLEPAALRVLDLVAADLAAGGPDAAGQRLVDVGTGTGTLAIAAAERWRELRVLGVDASDGMLGYARLAADQRLGSRAPAARANLVFRQGLVDRLPDLAEGADVVVSSFVYQLVPSRSRALREAWRVLRPGGRLAWVTWLDHEGARFGADEVFDEALEAVGLEARGGAEDDGRAGDLPSVRAAADQVRRAGFRTVTAFAEALVHDFTPESYLGFLAGFDEEDLFTELDADVRGRLEVELLTRLRARPAADLRMELPVVYASGVKPPTRS